MKTPPNAAPPSNVIRFPREHRAPSTDRLAEAHAQEPRQIGKLLPFTGSKPARP